LLLSFSFVRFSRICGQHNSSSAAAASQQCMLLFWDVFLALLRAPSSLHPAVALLLVP
jgi:hypothetical protein